MKKTSNIIQISLFCAFIFGFFILNLIIKDRSFSERENRYLEKAPAFSVSSLISGKFTSGFESYITDQFALRDSWTTIKARSELISGKHENNGVYLCAGDVLIPRFDEPDEERFENNLEYVNTLVENVTVPVYFELIPGACAVWSDKLPHGAPCADQFKYIRRAYDEIKAQTVDVASVLNAHKDEYIFYRTDHHWTSLGAYYGYTALGTALGYTPSPLESYSRRVVSEDFYGTSYSSSGISWVAPDDIEIFVDGDNTEVTAFSAGSAVKGELYKTEQLGKKDKYSMFLGGNNSLLQIKTGNDGKPKLLLIRDSYADSRVPFLLENFSEIHLIDLRYYKLSIADYVRENGIDEVLVSYSVKNFCEDTNLFLLTR